MRNTIDSRTRAKLRRRLLKAWDAVNDFGSLALDSGLPDGSIARVTATWLVFDQAIQELDMLRRDR